MRILCVGGGSGGHVTPIVAVVEELRRCHYEMCDCHPEPTLSSRATSRDIVSGSLPDSTGSCSKREPEIRVWVDKKFAAQTRELLGDQTRVDVIASGKLRRYANLGFWHKYFSWYHITKTHLPNLIDFFKIVGGFFQSICKLVAWRPDVVFAKGGYVCLPVGMAAKFLRIPLVIHDSDSVPGLTNRILAGSAAAIGTGFPVENYPSYPKKITKFIGIPVRPEIRKLSNEKKKAAKEKLKLNPEKKLIFVVGGGGGAQIFVDAFKQIAPKILGTKTQIVLQTGKGRNFTPNENLRADFFVHEFITDDYASLMNVCDVLVTRAGVTSLAEAATVGVPTIIVPSPYLSGDHQTKNAAVYEKANAAIVLKQSDLEKNVEVLSQAIDKILHDETGRKNLEKNIAKFARPDALKQMVEMILGAAKNGQVR